MPLWKSSSRRGFDVVQRLAQLADAPVMAANTDLGMPADIAPAWQAQTLGEIGAIAVGQVIETALDPAGERGANKTWKGVDADDGAAAAIFAAHAMAETSGRASLLEGFPAEHATQQTARTLLRDHYPWADEDELAWCCEPLTGGADIVDAIAIADLRVAASVLARVFPGQHPEDTPGMQLMHGDDIARYTGHMSWQICWTHALRPWLRATDPAKLQRTSG